MWRWTILIVREETRCCHIGYSFWLAARVLLYAPFHRQDYTYHSLCYTSHGALAGTRNLDIWSLVWMRSVAMSLCHDNVMNLGYDLLFGDSDWPSQRGGGEGHLPDSPWHIWIQHPTSSPCCMKGHSALVWPTMSSWISFGVEIDGSGWTTQWLMVSILTQQKPPMLSV